jgi:hypothetical protein
MGKEKKDGKKKKKIGEKSWKENQGGWAIQRCSSTVTGSPLSQG